MEAFISAEVIDTPWRGRGGKIFEKKLASIECLLYARPVLKALGVIVITILWVYSIAVILPYYKWRDLRLRVMLSSVHDHPAVMTKPWPGQPESKAFANTTIAFYHRFRKDLLGARGFLDPSSVPISFS